MQAGSPRLCDYICLGVCDLEIVLVGEPRETGGTVGRWRVLDFIPHPTTIILVVALAIVMAPPLATGLICGLRMDKLEMRKGALWGVGVGVVAYLSHLTVPLVNLFDVSHLVVVVMSVIATWLLCWRVARKGKVDGRDSSV